MTLKPYHQGQLDYFCAIYALINALRLTHGIRLAQGRGILNGTLREISSHALLWRSLLQNRTDSHWLMDYLLGNFCREGSLALRVARLPSSPPFSRQLKEVAGFTGQAASVHLRRGLEACAACFDDEQFINWLGLRTPEPVALAALGEADLRRTKGEFECAASLRSGETTPAKWSIDELRAVLRRWLPVEGVFKPLSGETAQKRSLLLRFHRFLPFERLPLVSHWSTARSISLDTLRLYDCTADKQAIHSLQLRRCALCPEELNKKRLIGLEIESMYFIEKV
ncbi:MAG: hypothetical protein LBD82_06630 [Deltaproteobacteria bacterium]|jgi:hypothetical protein|nr:hypothetical protein [Deltaproteobacteria bacterium]